MSVRSSGSAVSAPGLRIRVRGIVQGVGFRPFIYRLAHEHRLTGSVANVPDGVIISVSGDSGSLDRFVRDIERRRPPLARITSLKAEPAAVAPSAGFVIAPSEPGAARAAGRALIPSDVAVCDACLRELFDPRDRRHRYPFINCTDCGPRYTIITGLPYDRPLTTMAPFTMCEACRAEYEDPLNRRFHAEPVACPACGPRLALADGRGRPVACDDPVTETIRRLSAGQIVAIKGIGGFHLAVDATSDAAVRRLRERKRREEKPLALMAPSIARVRAFCQVSETEAALLSGPEKPIVLLDRLPGEPSPIAAAVAPGQVTLGVMLPYTPLHALLFDSDLYAIVLTSGNLSEEPIASRNDEAFDRLAGIADVLLVHDRDIHRHADDSVARLAAGEPRLMRRGRGYAPRPIALTREAPSVLAVGGQLKNTICVTRGREAFLSPHIGDLENLETYRAFEASIDHLSRSLGVTATAIAHDVHPDYASTQWARRQYSLPLVPVQHHHAHVAAVLAEHGVEGPAVGVVLDGTGYGIDGEIWGGEILVADLVDVRRAAHIPYVPMLGGELAAREPWRMAVAWLDRVFRGQRFELPPPLGRAVGERRVRLLLDAHRSGFAFPLTSSCGRLFDAVAALCGLRMRMSYEGQAALELEGAAETWLATTHHPPSASLGASSDGLEITIDAVVRAVVEEATDGLTAGEIAARFHVRLGEALAQAALTVAAAAGLRTVALGGGCFQNRLLLTGVSGRLRREGLDVLIPEDVPVNDGGVSLGQAAVAAARLRSDPHHATRTVEPPTTNHQPPIGKRVLTGYNLPMSDHTHSDKHQTHLYLVRRLRDQIKDIERLTRGLDETQLATRTVPDKWSLKELVCHLLSVQRVFGGRIERMLAEDRPPLVRFDVDRDPDFDRLVARPASETLTAFRQERDELASRLERLAPADWHRAGQHPEFPNFDVHLQVEYMTHHEAHHVYQMLQRRIPLAKVPH